MLVKWSKLAILQVSTYCFRYGWHPSWSIWCQWGRNARLLRIYEIFYRSKKPTGTILDLCQVFLLTRFFWRKWDAQKNTQRWFSETRTAPWCLPEMLILKVYLHFYVLWVIKSVTYWINGHIVLNWSDCIYNTMTFFMQIVNVICCQGNFYGHLTPTFKDQARETL